MTTILTQIIIQQVVVGNTITAQSLQTTAIQTVLGIPGAKGTNGTIIYSGTGAPASTLGLDGDFYIDTSISVFYGPKAAGVWPAGVSLRGDVAGPVSAINAHLAVFDGATGKIIKDGGAVPATLPASDVYAWAKAAVKPTYTNAEVGAAATVHSHAESDVANLVTDLAGKAAASHTHLLSAGATDVTATAAELNYVDGVTSAIQTQLDGKAAIAQSINAQTGTTYTLALTDAGKLVTFGNAAATTITIPTNASVAFPTGTHIDCLQIAAGKVTFAGTGVTINSKASNKSIGAQWVGVTLVKTATDTWSLLGDLVA